MKRILLTVLAITLCLTIFSGCNKECEHNWERIGNYNESTAQDMCTKCGETRLYTDPDSVPGKRLPIVMTIAETLPSCVAFEYNDEKPYCFYAYDDDGKLYRVFWNDFSGLNEKDRIVVDHKDDIKKLSYDGYPDGGWTPQYEVTAISIYSEDEWNDIIESSSPTEYFQLQKNDNGVIVFNVVAGFPQAKYTFKDSDAEEYVGIALDNENGEINSLLFGLLNGKSTISDEGTNAFTHSISMTCSYTSDDGYSEITVVYEFKWASTSNTITIFKNNTLVGTVLLTDGEMSSFKNTLNNLQ